MRPESCARQRRHVSVRVSLSGSDDTAANVATALAGSRHRAGLVALVTKLLDRGESAYATKSSLTKQRQASRQQHLRPRRYQTQPKAVGCLNPVTALPLRPTLRGPKGCGPLPTAQRHQMQRLQQRVRILTDQLHRCAAGHSKLQHRLATLEQAAELRCARLQQQVQALQRMQERPWTTESDASTDTTSCFGSPRTAAALAAGPAMAEENKLTPGDLVDARHQRAASLSEGYEDVVTKQDTASETASQHSTTAKPILQRVDSLEQLEASCRSVTGRKQQATAAAHGFEGMVGQATAEDSTYGKALTTQFDPQPQELGSADGSQPSDQADAVAFEAAAPDAAQDEQVPISGSRRGTDSSVAAENAWLRQKLTHLRAEHISTRVKLQEVEAAAARREARQAALLQRAQEAREKAARMAAAEVARLAEAVAAAHQDAAAVQGEVAAQAARADQLQVALNNVRRPRQTEPDASGHRRRSSMRTTGHEAGRRSSVTFPAEEPPTSSSRRVSAMKCSIGSPTAWAGARRSTLTQPAFR